MKKLLFLGIALLISGLSFGQSISNYAFTASSGTFTPIVAGTSVATSTSVADFLGDTRTSVAIPIGFTFYYMGVPYTQVKAMSDGYISFNMSATSALTNNLNSSSATQRPLLAPLWDDLDGASGSGSASYITEGTAGSRIFTIEWINWQWNYSASGATISFQVKLYEGSGKIEFIYQQAGGAVNSGGASIGITAIATGAGNFMSLSDASAAPTASTASETTSISVIPASGQTYTFTPPAAPTAATNLTFTTLGATKMTLNWTDSPDELAYAIQNSTDGITYTTVTSLAANTVTYNATGLTPNTLYYWKVIATNEGAGAELSGTESTLPLSPLHGVYAINNTLPTTATLLHNGTDNFNSFTDAINALNDNGVSGPVIFGVMSGQAFPEDCPAITATGTSTNTITFTNTGGANPIIQPTGGAGSTDAGITISGGDYFTFNGIDIAGGNAVEYGYFIKNASATDGAMNNTISNSKITLDKTNTSTRAIYQYRDFTASAASGANSNNIYHKNIIENSYQGVYMYGSSSYPDLDCIVDSNTVGAATAEDIGGGSSASAGIRASYQSGITIAANTVRNVYTSSATVSGIFLESTQGTNYVFNNNVYTISTTSTTATNYVYGIRTDINSTHTVNVFNNMISDLSHGIVTPSATTSIRALAVGVSGTGTANIAYNSVSIIEDASPSSAAFYFNGGSANLINNVFANFSTGGPTSKRYSIYRGTGTLVSENNDLYINAGVNSFIGYYAADILTLAAWQTASGGQDMTSISIDPAFILATDLHSISSALNGVGIPVTGITFDIDGDTRDLNFPDLGADENLIPPIFTCSTPAPGNTIITPGSLCLGDAVVVSLQNATTGTGVTYQWQESADGVTYSDIVGETSPVYSTTPTGATYYQCIVACAVGPDSTTSTPAQVTFTNSISSTTDGSRCGTGTVDLDATGTGTSINWYDAITGGSLLGTGTSFTTPSISATTIYYVAAETSNPATATVGAGASTSTGYQSPFYHYYGGLKEQYLIPATELSAAGISAGNITALSFDVVVAGTSYSEFNLSIGHTGLSALTSTFQTGLTSVYSAVSETPTVGIYTITFATPFYWDGSSNIIVETCWSNNNSGGTSTTVKYDATSYVSNSYNRADNQSPAVLCGSTSAYSTLSQRPKMIFTGTSSCSSPRVEVVATVVDAPVITLTPSATTICDGDTLDLNVSSSNVGYTYDWSAGTSPATGADVIAIPSTNTNYTVTASDTSGGTYDGCVTTADVDITVNPSPSNVTATATDNDICAGTAIDLSSSAISGELLLQNYSEDFEAWPPTAWTFINNGSGNDWATNSTAYSGLASMSYTYNSSNAADAWAITPAQSLVSGTTYTISFMYEVAGSTFPEKLKVTVGNDATVAAQTDILWDNNGGASLTNTTWALATFTYDPLVTGDYYFGFNCYSAANMFRLYVDSVSISGATSIPATYAWTSNPAGFATSSQDTAGVIPAATTEYIVTAGNSFGCYTSASTTVNVNANPIVDLGADFSICDTSSTVLDAGNPGAIFDWSTGGTSQTETFSGSVGAGTYDVSVEVTNAAGCATSDTITITVTTCTGIEDPTLSISMYPNPATEQLNLDLSELPAGDYSFELISLTGQQIMKQVIINDGTVITLSLRNVAPGSYIVRISGNDNSFQNRISIQ